MRIFTDGATSLNGYEGSRGGWAFVILDNNGKLVEENSGHIEPATNNICELTAIIEACKAAQKYEDQIEVFSDSAYVVNCYNNGWYIKWRANGWINSKKEEVKNRDLWEQLIPFFEDSRYFFSKVKGHSVNYWNNYVDQKAVAAKGLNGG